MCHSATYVQQVARTIKNHYSSVICIYNRYRFSYKYVNKRYQMNRPAAMEGGGG